MTDSGHKKRFHAVHDGLDKTVQVVREEVPAVEYLAVSERRLDRAIARLIEADTKLQEQGKLLKSDLQEIRENIPESTCVVKPDLSDTVTLH